MFTTQQTSGLIRVNFPTAKRPYNRSTYHCGLWLSNIESSQSALKVDDIIISNVMWGNLFQHFIQDLLYVLFYCKNIITPRTKIMIPCDDMVMAKTLLELIGISNDLVQIPHYGDYVDVDGKVTLIDWVDKDSDELTKLSIPYRRRCIQRLRESFDSTIQDLFIFVTRPSNKPRAWKNEPRLRVELKRYAQRKGLTFHQFSPHNSTDTLTSHLQLFNRAAIVVFIHGGAGYHIISCLPKTIVLEVVVPNSHNFGWWIESCDLDYRQIHTTFGGHDSIEQINIKSKEIIEALS